MRIGTFARVVVGLLGIPVVVGSGSCTTPGAYPERGLTLIVAYGAGGGTDASARLLANDLGTTIGRPVTVQNIAGGGGWNGWSAIANAAPDGYAIGYLNVPNIFAGYLNPDIGRSENLDSFTLLMNHVTDYCVWAVRTGSPFKSIADVIEAAKIDAGGVSIAAHGYGGDDHLAILSMQDATGVELRVIHNRSTADSKAQILGGHVDVVGANVSEVVAEYQAGEMRVLGVMSPTRSEFLPDVPTFTEQGYDEEWAVSRGIAAPKGLPQTRVDALMRFLETAIASEGHRREAARLSLALEVKKGKAFEDFLKTQEQHIKRLMGW
jgi:tripartite-type tricarboxylate transporter receptor subunit TctC